eukprot:TRINITY_DN1072_c0_g1_i2.p2 TRINITY_DN1072_c0_g1~~TRINITY_DN1072_c0_g1_i2.p2  ORF type:complete len:284 (+),score=70.88 TRINITY_DN1072_c0_g1_i2:25-852(+)
MLKIGFIGAGGVNFGGVDPGAPWDHASRLERIYADGNIDITVVGIAEPDQTRANFVLEQRQGNGCTIWIDTVVFADYREMLPHIDCVFIGLPPNVHGDIEVNCANAGVHMFIEKPLHCKEPKEVYRILDAVEKNGVTVSVGYMLRYCKAVQFIKDFLKEKNSTVTSVSARYNSAYTAIPKPMWWDLRRSGGPVIEQGTHFCDLHRYLGGDVDIDSVQAVAVSPLTKPGFTRIYFINDQEPYQRFQKVVKMDYRMSLKSPEQLKQSGASTTVPLAL